MAFADLLNDPVFAELRCGPTKTRRRGGQTQEIRYKSIHHFHFPDQPEVVYIRRSNKDRRKTFASFVRLAEKHGVDLSSLRGDERGKDVVWMVVNEPSSDLISIEEYLERYNRPEYLGDLSESAEESFDISDPVFMSGWSQ